MAAVGAVPAVVLLPLVLVALAGVLIVLESLAALETLLQQHPLKATMVVALLLDLVGAEAVALARWDLAQQQTQVQPEVLEQHIP